ncbi:MAG: tRNA (adenosine(37)-N6)-threonylcarbamoyltransferase complex transferase subunit TsaD [Kiritimatiellaeota bacterium]|nr:tRNA (adenosine(37)-N6)-threonylcarbamoyltransferase complex transferase subunit TsaD [Kiritimatiellota bacterium]
MNVLGIETSCDETAAAVVADGGTVLSSAVFSQVAVHRPHGGVVPEIAARQHVEHLPCMLDEAMTQSGLEWSRLQAVAVTYGPGLASSLLVGLSAAKALALRLNIPLIGINHLEAHLYSVFLAPDAPCYASACPLVALIISGGHTCLVRVDAPGQYRRLGQTIDDAAGEAFDKGAKLLGLEYPGGPVIDRVSALGDADCIVFPRTRVLKADFAGGLTPELCFSFSGLKTSLLYYLRDHPEAIRPPVLEDVAAGYQEAIVDVLVRGAQRALRRERVRTLVVAGGVSLNRRLRAKLLEMAAGLKVNVLLPASSYCVDNAAMVAGLAGIGQGITGEAAWLLDASPNLEIGG